MAAVEPLAPGRAGRVVGEKRDSHAGLARQFHYYVWLMREVEDCIERRLYRQGKIVGGVYVGRGQEAIPVGAGLVSEPDIRHSGRDRGRQ